MSGHETKQNTTIRIKKREERITQRRGDKKRLESTVARVI
jgi:hypothetical protein